MKKLEAYGVSRRVVLWFSSYLHNRFQKVKITNSGGSSCFSNWSKVRLGVPQGSKVGPFLFLVYANDLFLNVNSNLILFADDTTALVKAKDKTELALNISNTVEDLCFWLDKNGLNLNCAKTKILEFTTTVGQGREFLCPFSNTNIKLSSSNSADFLGLTLQNNLKWHNHTDKLFDKLNKALFNLKIIRKICDDHTVVLVYYGYFLSVLRYGLLFWGNSSSAQKIFKQQKIAVRVIAGICPRVSCKPSFRKYKFLTLPALYILELALFIKNNMNFFKNCKQVHSYNTRHKALLQNPSHRLTLFHKGPYYQCIQVYNKLSSHLRNENLSVNLFKKELSFRLIELCPYSVEEFLLS